MSNHAQHGQSACKPKARIRSNELLGGIFVVVVVYTVGTGTGFVVVVVVYTVDTGTGSGVAYILT